MFRSNITFAFIINFPVPVHARKKYIPISFVSSNVPPGVGKLCDLKRNALEIDILLSAGMAEQGNYVIWNVNN